MKIEKRGKYAGVKVHLEPEECEQVVGCLVEGYNSDNVSLHFARKLGKKIKLLLEEEPNLLKDRTPEEIQHELEVEYESASLKLAAMKKGKDWKGIHI